LLNVGKYATLPINSNMQTAAERILRIVGRHGIVRPKELEKRGIARENLLRLFRKGVLDRSARGVYVLANAPVSEHHSLAVAAKQVPRGVICLISALQFHGLTTQVPHEIWIAIDVKAHRPTVSWPPLKVVRFSGQALAAGVEEHKVEGVPLKVYSSAKTVADCFKYRNKIGIDLAIEALRDALRQKKATLNEIHHFAKVCRVARVMRPYLESVAS
jgi:predicted transcriptional regulator of viral defense system